MITFWDRCCYFLHNLFAFLLSIPADIVYFPVVYIRRIRLLFITDGSEELSYPWEWDWHITDPDDDIGF